MTSLLFSFKELEKLNDLELHVEDLLRQYSIINDIKRHTYNKYDAADMLETRNLLAMEIERCQELIKEYNSQPAYEEEEEELILKYNLEEVIRDEDGKLRPLRPGDLDIDKHEGVRKAFKEDLYEMQRDYELRKEYEEEEEETSNIFDIKEQECFIELIEDVD